MSMLFLVCVLGGFGGCRVGRVCGEKNILLSVCVFFCDVEFEGMMWV